MSYILEALKKSEQERQIGHVPDISQLQEMPVARSAPRWPRWLLAALLVNAIILVTLAWRTWDARRATVIGPSPVAPAPSVAQSVPSSEPPATPARSAPAPMQAPAQPESVAQLPEPVTQMPAAAPAMETATSPSVEPEPLAEEAAVVEPEPELPPRWEDLPLEERTALPAPRIDVHVFAQEPERRFVLINLHKYQVGDTLDGGATLIAIHADGIVLSYGGRQYRLDRP